MEELKIQQKDGKIFAPLTGKWHIETPEELVRQDYICKLVNEYGYSLDQMTQELKLTSSSRGTGSARADIVIWATSQDKNDEKSPVIVIECKAQNITIKEEDYFQGQNYAYFSGAKFFVTTNEKETKYFQVIHGIVPKRLGNEIIAIPKAEDLKNDKKIEKLLNATKAFERDEFAKLLFACHNIIRNNDKYSPEMALLEISNEPSKTMVILNPISISFERLSSKGFSDDNSMPVDKLQSVKANSLLLAPAGFPFFVLKHILFLFG